MTQEQQKELVLLAHKLNKAVDEYKPWKEFYDKVYSDSISDKEQMQMMHTKNWLKVWGELDPWRQDWCRHKLSSTPWGVLKEMKEQKYDAWWNAYCAYHDKHLEYCGWDALL